MQIVLHGILAERFPHLNHRNWNARSVAHAVNLLKANCPEGSFARTVRPLNLHIYDPAGDRYIGEHTLGWDTGAERIDIMPAVEGSGRTAMIVVGTVLLVMAAAAMTLGTGGFGAPAAWGLLTAGEATLLGASLVVGGLMMPAQSDYDAREERQSVLYQGGANRSQQGSPVPLVLGREVRQGGVIISTGIDVLQEQYDPGAV